MKLQQKKCESVKSMALLIPYLMIQGVECLVQGFVCIPKFHEYSRSAL